MLKLSAALSGWNPGERAVRDPIVLLEAGWGDIVGKQVAENSHPSRVVAGALTIVTRSNAWSHQLSLLSEHVLRAVGARVPDAGIDRLRFRVGALPRRQRRPAPASQEARHAVGVTKRSEPASAAEALDRFRQEVERSNHAKRSAGWKGCAKCGALVEPNAERCAACAIAGAQARAEMAARVLFEAPWLGYAGTAGLVDGLRKEEYERVRAQLLWRWWEMLARARAANRLSRDGRERLVASSYVLLHSRIPPEEILPATVRSILGDELHDLIYSEQQRA